MRLPCLGGAVWAVPYRTVPYTWTPRNADGAREITVAKFLIIKKCVRLLLGVLTGSRPARVRHVWAPALGARHFFTPLVYLPSPQVHYNSLRPAAEPSTPPDTAASALLLKLFKLMNDREPAALRDSNWLFKRRLYVAVAQQLLCGGPPTGGDPICSSSPAWMDKPQYGQVYRVALRVTMQDLEAAAKEITAEDSVVDYTDSLHAWARAWLALPVEQRRAPCYIGLTEASLNVRFVVGAHAHLCKEKCGLLGRLLHWLQRALGTNKVGVEVSLVFTSAQIKAAVMAAMCCAEKHSIEHVDLTVQHVLGFAEQTAAAWHGTQLWLGGLNAGPTGTSPPHPNSEPQRLAGAVALQRGCDIDTAKQQVSVREAVKMCRTGTSSWSTVEGQLDRFAGPHERETMTIEDLMTAIARYAGGYPGSIRGAMWLVVRKGSAGKYTGTYACVLDQVPACARVHMMHSSCLEYPPFEV